MGLRHLPRHPGAGERRPGEGRVRHGVRALPSGRRGGRGQVRRRPAGRAARPHGDRADLAVAPGVLPPRLRVPGAGDRLINRVSGSPRPVPR